MTQEQIKDWRNRANRAGVSEDLIILGARLLELTDDEIAVEFGDDGQKMIQLALAAANRANARWSWLVDQCRDD